MVRENALFEKFYALQEMMTEEEFTAFLSCLVHLDGMLHCRKRTSPLRCD